VPEPPVILVEDKLQTRLVELVATARATVPVNPLRGATVIVEVPATPEFTVTLVGLAARVKSCTITLTLVELVVLPLTAFTVTVKVPAEPLHDNAEVLVAGTTTLVGVNLQDSAPGPPVTVVERLTVPVKVPLATTVMVEVAAVPALTVTLVGLALRLIPGVIAPWTITVTTVEFEIPWFVPAAL